MNRDQFIARWRAHVAGTIALGGQTVRKSLSGATLTDEIVGKALLDLGPTTDNLLGRLYDSLFPKTTEDAREQAQPGAKAPAPNGQSKQATGAQGKPS